jgi:hypothetical protein
MEDLLKRHIYSADILIKSYIYNYNITFLLKEYIKSSINSITQELLGWQNQPLPPRGNAEVIQSQHNRHPCAPQILNLGFWQRLQFYQLSKILERWLSP